MTNKGGGRILEPFQPPSTASAWVDVFRFTIMGLIFAVGFSLRLFSVLRYESVIHEFDPYFNFRTTKFLVSEGFYNFINYYDEMSWYPMGRHVSETVYPGLMLTAGFIHWLLNSLHLTIAIRNVCVLTAPLFACFTSLALYLLTSEATKNKGAGLFAAAFGALVPGYISRSVAGSYDNEAVAIFALVFSFYVWVKAVNTGSMFWGVSAALAYFYMVAAWGGYIFIINLIPLHVLALLLCNRYSANLYVAYCLLYTLGTLLSMRIPFVSFNPVTSGDHLAAFGVFGLLQLWAFVRWLYGLLDPTTFRRVVRLAVLLVLSGLVLVSLAAGYLFTGRLYALLDPTYAKNHIPIIASVSEHQPIVWTSYASDLHMLIFLLPVGLFVLFRDVSDSGIFLILYGLSSLYFSSSMVRLLLVLSPAACSLAGIAVSEILRVYLPFLKFSSSKKIQDVEVEEIEEPRPAPTEPSPRGKGGKGKKSKGKSQPQKDCPPAPAPPATTLVKKETTRRTANYFGADMALVIVILVSGLLTLYVLHSVYVSSEAYSSPSIVLMAWDGRGGRIIFDDFREAYSWLRHNTVPDAKVMSWWDYGYQISAMANRTVIVDNNTRNNSHIAQVGAAFASTETEAIKIIRHLDVDYVLVIFGGMIGYSGDDINKFLWMVRIAGGVDPKFQERDYFTKDGNYRIGSDASPTMRKSLMYKLCYYNFDKTRAQYDRENGYDRVRGEVVGEKNIRLLHMEEAFTSQHWMVRIYRVLPPRNRDRPPRHLKRRNIVEKIRKKA